jgi:hypothetical protein
VETAQFFPDEVGAELSGELVCYGRSVVGVEWPRLDEGSQGNELNPWGAELFHTLQTVEPETASEESAYGKWLDQTSEREAARNDRIHGAAGVIPSPLWVVLFFISGVIFVFMLFFADRGERAVVQALLVGSVVSVIVTMLLLLRLLDDPFHEGVGGLRPVAMERALEIVDQALAVAGRDEPLPCDASGVRR